MYHTHDPQTKRRHERRHLHSLVYVQTTHKKIMNQEGVPFSNKCVRQHSLVKKVRPAGRSFAGKTIDFGVVTLAPNIAHVHSHSGTPKRRVPH